MHYEVIVNGKRVNSQKLKLPSGKVLKDKERKLFETSKIKLEVLKSEKIIGLKNLRTRTFVHAHGTGTPANRTTESHILNEVAKTYGIKSLPVNGIKSYLGHSMAPASGDQLTTTLGTWNKGIIPGYTLY